MWIQLLACIADPGTTPGTPTVLPTVDAPVWVDEAHDLSTAWRFHALLPSAAEATVTCTRVDEPTEIHTTVSAASTLHDLVMYGLLADTDYDCVLGALAQETTRSVRTPILPDWLPTWSLPIGGGPGDYTLLNHGTSTRGDRQTKVLVIDHEGGLRWYLEVPFDAADLDTQYLGEGYFLYGGGYAAPPTMVDLAGTVWAQAPASSTGLVYHHHAERLSTGEFVTLTVAENTDGTLVWDGFAIDVLDPGLFQRTWSWNSQRGVDEGWLAPPTTALQDDPFHANSIQEDGDAFYVNLRQRHVLFKLDRTSGDMIWMLGPGTGGEFTLVDDTGAAAPLADWAWGAHAPEVDGDRILFHDNGYTRPGGPFSRVMELEFDEAARTARVLWRYSESGWYEPIWGDVDRLANGNVFFTRAHCRTCTAEDSPQRTELVEVDPTTDAVVWRLSFPEADDASYRASRIDACSLFANQRYCPPGR